MYDLETYVGSAVKISAVVDIIDGGSIDSITCTVIDKDGVEKMPATAMGAAGDKYSAIYQSDPADQEGLYKAIITVTSGAYTDRDRALFILRAL
jgi:hypothetical protein